MSKRILIATYGILMNTKEMERHDIGAIPIAKGVIENYDLAFRGLPSSTNGQPMIIEKDDQDHSCHVPVLLWSIPCENEVMLEEIELHNTGQYTKKYLLVREIAYTVEGVLSGFPSNDEITALVYIPDGERISKQLPISDFNVLFSAYMEHDIASLDLTAVAAKTIREEWSYENIKENLQSTPLAGENPEIVSNILITRRLLEMNGANFSADGGDEDCNS